jgi:hypothetical protein
MNPGESAAPSSFRTTHCERHGDMQEAFVCEHLLKASQQGFLTDSEDTSNPRPDAWCSACEDVRSEHGGWNAESEALITVKLVCGGCYDEIKAKNILPSNGSSRVQ